MPFSYEQIEDAVVSRLTTTLASYAVTIPLPDIQKEVDDATKSAESANKALVLVIYDSSGFESSSSTNYARQQENMDIVCHVRASKRRGPNGVMNMIQLIKLSLQGFIPANATRMFLKEIKLDEHDYENKIFSYNVTFTCSKLHVQNFLDGDDLEGAILTQVTWQDKSISTGPFNMLGDFNANDFSADFKISA